MERGAPQTFDDIDACVDWIIERAGPRLQLALPLGLGKANLVANAIYRRALADPSLRLTITTALSLEIPRARSDLERRFLAPFVVRVFGDYPGLEYALDRRARRLPENIDVVEFFMAPGALLNNEHAQQNYVSSNYTHITRDLIDRGVNVIGQLVTHRAMDNGRQFSLSCNPDLTLDIAARQRAAGKPLLMVGEVNHNLPFMYGDAVVPPSFFDAVVETPDPDYRLFGTPKTAISTADYMIGMYASTLVCDGGTLQLGIGSLGDAVVYALQLRHQDNPRYRQVLTQCRAHECFGHSIDRIGSLSAFNEGLYGATEMLVDGFLYLYQAGILKRRVYNDVVLQRLLNQRRINETVTSQTLLALTQAGVIGSPLAAGDVAYLKHWGVLRSDVDFERGQLVFADGSRCHTDTTNPECCRQIEDKGLGERLLHGVVAHGGFFLGPQSFYDGLNALSETERKLINMTSVLSVNQLYGNEELDSLQRKDARFINSCLIATLTGAVVSDGLEDQRVLSGVGGQFNFVSMAHALRDGHSILKVRSTRKHGGTLSSNIRLRYGHTTVPRHMRDFVVSEYGIADLRGRSDREVVTAMLNIADSRFQPTLLAEAKQAGKLPKQHRISDEFCNNTPARLDDALKEARAAGAFPPYPFGTDLTEIEQVLAPALRRLADRTATRTGRIGALVDAIRADIDGCKPYLQRLGLDAPTGIKQKVLARLVAREIDLAL